MPRAVLLVVRMNDDSDDVAWPPAMWASALQEMGEEAAEQQMHAFRQMWATGPGSGTDALSQLGSLGMGAAVFKTRVQSGGRISIPDTEREALGIEEGDIVQTVVVPLTDGDPE